MSIRNTLRFLLTLIRNGRLESKCPWVAISADDLCLILSTYMVTCICNFRSKRPMLAFGIAGTEHTWYTYTYAHETLIYIRQIKQSKIINKQKLIRNSDIDMGKRALIHNWCECIHNRNW